MVVNENMRAIHAIFYILYNHNMDMAAKISGITSFLL